VNSSHLSRPPNAHLMAVLVVIVIINRGDLESDLRRVNKR
jgi:hypothetical protein